MNGIHRRILKRITMMTQTFNVSGYEVLIDTANGVYPYFIFEIRGRMHRKLSTNIVLTGEAGISKTYTAMLICKMLNKRFDIEDIVLNFKDYMEAILKKGKKNVPILFDEPQGALDKRDWYNDVNKALVKTITSQRFRRRPLIIPIINQSLLDVNLRKYLLNYHIILTDRGIGKAYKLSASQVEDKLYRKFICEIQYGLMDKNLCQKDCLSCRQLHTQNPDKTFTCEILRAKYERKKALEMDERDKQSVQKAKQREAASMPNLDIAKGLAPHIARMLYVKTIKGTKTRPSEDLHLIDTTKIPQLIQEVFGISVGINRNREIRNLLEQTFPQYARKLRV
jgi:hypothetical protein